MGIAPPKDLGTAASQELTGEPAETQPPKIEEQDIQSQIQCALFLDVYAEDSYSRGLKKADEQVYRVDGGYPAFTRAKYRMGSAISADKPRSRDPYFRRIVPMRISDPTIFVNRLHNSYTNVTELEFSAGRDVPGLEKSLFWVYEEGGEIKEAELQLSSFNVKKTALEDIHEAKRLRYKALRTGNAAAASTQQAAINTIKNNVWHTDDDRYDYFLESANVVFEGTNISTARNDVQVTLKFELESFAALKTQMNTEVGIELQELITLPITGRADGGPGFMIKNQYSPNYSRLRFKVAATGDSKTNLILDLAIIDHKITRESEIGRVTLEINYRGYQEQMLSMPFNDALATNEVIEQRKARQALLDDAAQKDCDPVTIREILAVDQASLREEKRNLQFSTFLDRLVERGYIHAFSVDLDEMRDSSANILKSNALKQSPYPCGPNIEEGENAGNFEEKRSVAEKTAGDKDYGWGWHSVIPSGLYDWQYNSGVSSHYCFYIGDLMEIATDCIFEEKSHVHRDHVSNLDLKFMVGDIEIPNPNNMLQPLVINPLCIPVSMQFFAKWWNDTVVRKNLSYYPVGVFIKDLLERLVTNLLYEVCFASMLADEIPPRIRTSFFVDCSPGWYSPSYYRDNPKSKNGFFVLSDASDNDEDPILTKNAKYTGKVTNYCVVYQQSPPYFRESKRNVQGDKAPLKENPYVPTIIYGTKSVKTNYVSNVSFTKTDSPMLREARYFNNQNGSLSLLSNLYDLSFVFDKIKGNTFIYPGQVINFILNDWGGLRVSDGSADFIDGCDSDPHTEGTIANNLGFGGYYIVKRVSYDLGQTAAEYKISIETKFNGTDADREVRKTDPDTETIDIIREDENCAPIYDNMVRHYEDIGGGEEGEEQFYPADQGPGEDTTHRVDATHTARRVSSYDRDTGTTTTVELPSFERALEEQEQSAPPSIGDDNPFEMSAEEREAMMKLIERLDDEEEEEEEEEE